jgi:UDP-N-acetyl-D-mannosaminuronic acid transferase (WecB/TagA/CpsF family)
MHRVKLLNGEFDPFTLRQTVDAVFSMLREGQRGWLCTVNVAILMMMRSDAWLQTFVQRAALVVADGLDSDASRGGQPGDGEARRPGLTLYHGTAAIWRFARFEQQGESQ